MREALPAQVHRRACRDCPLAHRSPDDEALDVRAFVDAGLMTAAEATFVCGWRPGMRCRGAADFYGYEGTANG